MVHAGAAPPLGSKIILFKITHDLRTGIAGAELATLGAPLLMAE
jgi:hypothetical protein